LSIIVDLIGAVGKENASMSWQTPFQELLWNMVNLKITLKKEYSEIESGRITQGVNFATIRATIDFKKFYHDPTRYLSSQFLGRLARKKVVFM
jgi:hypothetical protein